MTRDSSLYRVNRKALCGVVVASSETHGKMVARKLPLDAFEAEGGDFHVVEITDPEKNTRVMARLNSMVRARSRQYVLRLDL